eukprot:GHVS01052400.1.p1 GENE.GHVS01052400.1~~GHVS01052400.1.p1  ORF type:complete len:388 (-),score=34.50 GHVS01052400.1:489-1652(-)
MMAILVLARAYVRSRFTPTVFRSWRLAAGRLPCYFILCLLLLEATPQTRKVAMGYLLDGLPTAEEQDHRQTRKLVGTALGTTSPFPSFGTVSLPLRNGGSGETSYTPSVPDIKTFRKELKEMPAGKPTLWSREVEAEIYGVVGGLNNELHKRVERNAILKGSEKLLEPTKGELEPFTSSIDFAHVAHGDESFYLNYIGEKLEALNCAFGVMVEHDENGLDWWTVLLDIRRFTPESEMNGTDYKITYVYMFNDQKERRIIRQSEVLIVVAASNPVFPKYVSPHILTTEDTPIAPTTYISSTPSVVTPSIAHTTDVHYPNKGFIIGLALTSSGGVVLASIFLFVFVLYIRKSKRKRANQQTESAGGDIALGDLRKGTREPMIGGESDMT